ALNIAENGIVQRRDDGSVVIVAPARGGAPPVEIEVEQALADTWNLATGDIVAGATEPIHGDQSTLSSEQWEDAAVADEERDEPAIVRGESPPEWLVQRVVPTERLVTLEQINGLNLSEAADRPSPRAKRHSLEREAPDHLVSLAADPNDVTGK